MQNDWTALTKKYLSDIFNSPFLVPLTDEEMSVSLRIKHTASTPLFLRALKENDLMDDLDRADPQYMSLAESVVEELPSKSQIQKNELISSTSIPLVNQISPTSIQIIVNED